MLWLDIFFIFPPLNPVNELILIFLLFATLAHLTIFLLVPDTENKKTISLALPYFAS